MLTCSSLTPVSQFTLPLPNWALRLRQIPPAFRRNRKSIWTNNSVDVIINGVTVAVNSALRFSKIIDSNGNGIPNFYDPNPFDVNPLKLTASLVQSNRPPANALV